jgi:DNA-directed RNA polymerase I and III subunit RPAC1
MPFPDQKTFPDVIPLYDDILLTKILPGQEIHLYCRAINRIGSDHAKFSHVAIAF